MREAVVTTFSRAIEAKLAAQALENAGIFSRLEEGSVTARNALAVRRFRRVKLLVAEAEYWKARDVLGLEVTDLESRPARALGVCPECGHASDWLIRLRATLRGRRRVRWRCEACGHAWKDA